MRWVGYQFNTSATTFRFLDWQQRVWLPSVCSTSKSPRPFTANTEPCQLRREPVAKKLEQKCADGRFCRLVRISILQVLFQRLQFPDIPRYRVRSELEVAVRWLRGLQESGPSSFHHWFHRPPQDMPFARCKCRPYHPSHHRYYAEFIQLEGLLKSEKMSKVKIEGIVLSVLRFFAPRSIIPLISRHHRIH